MAINPYGSDVLRSINRIIQSEQERDRSEVKEALSFMQFAMQKRQTEVKEFGQRMEVLSNANKQLQANVASNFLVNSGLSSLVNLIPTGLEDFSDAQDAIGDVTKQLKKKDYGKFSKENANVIASTLWEYKQTNDPSCIVNLANSIGQMTKRKPTSGEINLLKSLNKISNVSALSEVIRQAEQSTKNNSAILKEQFEFAKGDTKIQSGFGMLSEDVQDEFLNNKTQQKTSDMVTKLADEFNFFEESSPDELEYEDKPTGLDAKLEEYNDLNDTVRDGKVELKRLNELKRQGFKVDDKRISDLNEEIKSSLEEKNSMVGLAVEIARAKDIKRNVDKIEDLAVKILEDNELEATEDNLKVAKSRARKVIRQVPTDQFDSGLSDRLAGTRPAYDSMGRIQR